jgi:hypothetical protein
VTPRRGGQQRHSQATAKREVLGVVLLLQGWLLTSAAQNDGFMAGPDPGLFAMLQKSSHAMLLG